MRLKEKEREERREIRKWLIKLSFIRILEDVPPKKNEETQT